MRQRQQPEPLHDSRRYEAQIERLHAKHALSARMFTLRQDGVPLAAFVQDRSQLARMMSAEVAAGAYKSGRAKVRNLLIEGKERRIFSYQLTDAIVHGTVADVIADAMTARLSPCVFSYRRGVSRWTAVTAFAAFLRRRYHAQRDPRQRGVYVIRRDVDAYAESIPMGPESRIWEMVRELVDDRGRGQIAPEVWSLIERVVRPAFFTRGSRRYATATSGVATGQPVASQLFNLYLSDLDCELESIPGGFYARYSDDILFAHPDARAARNAADIMTRVLDNLGLKFNPSKGGDFFLNGAGRRADAWPAAKGTTAVTFLGTRVAADGVVALKSETVRAFVADLQRRARSAQEMVRHHDLDARGRVVCAVLNQRLEPHARSSRGADTAALLLRAVTDRHQLAQLDYRIARIVVRTVTGDGDVRAFRRVSYRKVRVDWKLQSLVHARNRWKRGAE